MKHKKGFYLLSECWYGASALAASKYNDEILIHFGKDEDNKGEFNIKWSTLAGDNVPKLEVYDDAWDTLADMPELIALLKTCSDENISPLGMKNKLLSIGYEDWSVKLDPTPVKYPIEEQNKNMLDLLTQINQWGFGDEEVDRVEDLVEKYREK